MNVTLKPFDFAQAVARAGLGANGQPLQKSGALEGAGFQQALTQAQHAIDVAGAWTYSATSAHDEFVAGVTHTDTFTVTSADGTTTSVTINTGTVLFVAFAGLVMGTIVMGGTLFLDDRVRR
mgnify:CR=1 FL=1